MKYLPIFQELFESDTIIFLMMGNLMAAIIGLRMRHLKKYVTAIMISAAVYAICELASNIHTHFMLEIILLFVGTVSMGLAMGFIICLVFYSAKGSIVRGKEKQ